MPPTPRRSRRSACPPTASRRCATPPRRPTSIAGTPSTSGSRSTASGGACPSSTMPYGGSADDVLSTSPADRRDLSRAAGAARLLGGPDDGRGAERDLDRRADVHADDAVG